MMGLSALSVRLYSARPEFFVNRCVCFEGVRVVFVAVFGSTLSVSFHTWRVRIVRPARPVNHELQDFFAQAASSYTRGGQLSPHPRIH